MPDTGWVLCGTAANGEPIGTWEWIDPANVTDGSTATESYCNFSTAGSSDTLLCTDFSALAALVPAGATIDGIEIRVQRAGDGVQDYSIYLIVGGVIKTLWDNKASGAWGATLEEEIYGGAADTWGASPALTRDDVIAATFGVAIAALGNEGSTASIYTVEARATYAPATATTGPQVMLMGSDL